MLDHAVIESPAPGHASGAQPATVSPAGLIVHIERMLAATRPAAARALLQALKRLDPQSHALAYLEARTLLAEGQEMTALGLLDAAIAQAGEDNRTHAVEMYLLRGQIRVGMGHFAQAVDDTAAAVMLDPNSTVPKLRLGVLLVQLGHFDEAIACLREAAAGHGEPAAQRGLAMAFERAGRAGEAAAVLAQAIATWPKDLELRGAAVMLHMRLRRFDEAVAQAALARQAGAIDAMIFGMMGDALAYLGRHTEAAEAYHAALQYAPNDMFLQQRAGFSRSAQGLDRAVPSQLRVMFDLAAPGFDQHVVARAYRVPGLIRRMLQYQISVGASPVGSTTEGELLVGPVLDLGCGTGLVGLAIAQLAGPLTGYDLSPVMLAAARLKRVYADLREGDMLSLMAGDERTWPLIVAGDSLVYFGALEPVFAAVRARLAPGGCFIFSLAEDVPFEDVPEPTGRAGWALSRAGSYVHTATYIEQALAGAGLTVCSREAEILHHEAEVPVPGWIIVARHATEAAELVA